MSAVIGTVQVDCPGCGEPFAVDVYAADPEAMDGVVVVDVDCDRAEVALQALCCESL